MRILINSSPNFLALSSNHNAFVLRIDAAIQQVRPPNRNQRKDVHWQPGSKIRMEVNKQPDLASTTG